MDFVSKKQKEEILEKRKEEYKEMEKSS